LKFEAGRIVLREKKETLKPSVLSEEPRNDSVAQETVDR
jgi:hypothetical protein